MKTMLFNPYTGTPRHPDDIKRDPQGLLIIEPGEPIMAAEMSTFTPGVKTPSEPSPTAGMNMAQRILHVGGRNNAAGYVEFGSVQAVTALMLQFVRDMVQPPMRRVSDGWKAALQQIAAWDSHDHMLGVDMGSNGVRDFYRQIARDALASAPPAPQAAKCATCNGNGLIGGPSFYAPDEGGVPCPDCSQAAVVQQEPIGFISPKQVELIGDPECEFGKYIPMRKTPAGNFTLALYTHPAPETKPIDMVLHCPKCGRQHIDAPEEHWNRQFLYSWENPPHRSHLCHGCGHIWRPADVPTNGVQAVKTKGKADSPVAVPHNSWTKLHEACALAMEALEKERQFAHGKRDFSMLSVRAIEALREAFRDQTGG